MGLSVLSVPEIPLNIMFYTVYNRSFYTLWLNSIIAIADSAAAVFVNIANIFFFSPSYLML